ncbi:MAG: hypothetical protein O7B99_12170, partial [Planctomycetota bacterium]|nr:hypothetical protein [Planctomycetota bacterium]
MRTVARSPGVAGVLALVAGLAAAQNEMPIDNEGDYVLLYSSPTLGSPTGTIPPDITTGDFYYQVHQGDRVMRHTDDATGTATIGINGFLEGIWDTDWSTTPSFYDRSIGPAVPDSVCSEGRMPAFFTAGFTTEVFISLGPSGFGSPCTLFPSFCSPSSSSPWCAPPGFVNGWGLTITLTSSIVVASDGTGTSDVANTYFLPSGMTHTIGTGACGLGDYSIQDAHSLDETQADYLGGVGSGCGGGLSEFGGFASGSSGPLQEAVTEVMEGTWDFDTAITNALADSGLGAGF